ncbi:hypothetical protein COZ78_03000 [bacterium (Candidatus Gribaldobacteria) CG_4_8_14_3_um_filter_42_11]|uniref:Transcriptional repressor PaaX-like central Cas2-like domain-containing protein n=2 Tax=Candidatus Gribaldobacteria TaxID=2798536 RepID=A0A2H0UWV4_9BACT|nr:MAG: hypothetical protein AUJ36_02705 [Parcubacteria group bacterium CG1_02_41_26]PIR91344.1 MAG: hypothetical protein COU03_02390 [bacterium (Candidatus Gribaldobacteria) CG10_big_fil_rev_8_21_14_0_10_41_12]PIX02962.1 MAG: hypothetical protein COZ78_03000 [bacterium (Candidatus Gribaldobacteria) CG_4_8_14_3_um_filter_42_11]
MARKLAKISVDIIKGIAIVGIFAIAAQSPNFLMQLSKSLYRKNKYFKNNYSERQINSALGRLKRSNILVLKEKNGKFTVELSEKGKKKIQQITIDDLKNKKPEQWDGLWRVVIFDIPERQKYGRAALREKMKYLGFYQLQKSVWAFPYDCEKEIELLANFFNIYDYVNFIEAKKITNDTELKQHFKFT